MGWSSILIVAGVAVLAAAMIYIENAVEKRRTQAFKQYAASHGMRFDLAATDVYPLMREFDVFSQGQTKQPQRLLVSAAGDDQVGVFDYSFSFAVGKNNHTAQMTIAAFRELPTELPAFTLRPESLFHKIGAAVGFQDIDLASYPEFSKRYLLRGKDEQAIERLLTGPTIEMIMNREPISIECDGSTMLVYRNHSQVDPTELSAFIEEARAIRSALLHRG